jgi:predicted RNA-binding Zn ribbon-like protein
LPKCIGAKRDGTPCKATVEIEDTLCWWHAPENAEERSRVASKAATAKHADSELSSVRRRLKELAESVLDGRVSTAKASVGAQVFGVYLRAVEQERKQKETEELALRVEELEDTIRSQQQRGGFGYGA